MDEPTAAIHPHSRNMLFEVLESLHSAGMDIIYTTHYMEEAQRLCSRIGIIDSGRIIAQGSLKDLREISNTRESIHIELSTDTASDHHLKELFPDIPFTHNGAQLDFQMTNCRTAFPGIISKLSENQYEISQAEICKANLETVFLNLTGRQLRD